MSFSRFSGLAIAAGVLMLGCGEGRLIFNVDLLSYEPTLADTLPYAVPGGTSLPSGQRRFPLRVIGLVGNSTVDSVLLRYGTSVLNAAGGGRFILEVFFGVDSATVFASPVSFVDTVVVAGPDTQLVGPISVSLLADDNVFTSTTIWVGVRGSLAADPGPVMTGSLVTVSVLGLRIILQDQIF